MEYPYRSGREIIYNQHLNRLRVRRAIQFLNSGGARGENSSLDAWVPDACAVEQLNIWTEQDLDALDEMGYEIVRKDRSS